MVLTRNGQVFIAVPLREMEMQLMEYRTGSLWLTMHINHL
jgi:hypothetical protein